MTRLRWLLVTLLFAGTQVQGQDVLILAIFPERAMIQVDGQRHVLRVGEGLIDGIRLVSTDSRAGHVVLEIAGQRRQIMLGSRAGGSFQSRQSARAQIFPNASGAYTTTGSINGRTVTFLVDTGATSVAISGTEARRLGIDYTRGQLTQVHTASGTAFAYRISLDRVRVGDIEQQNVEAMVVTGDAPRIALLGMTFLNRLEMRNEGQALVLEQRF